MNSPAPKSQTDRARRKAATYDLTYKRLRYVVMKTHPMCQHRGEQCTGFSRECHHLTYPATELHHLQAVCKACHRELEREKLEAR